MTKRINAIAKYINDDDKVIDVGCDSALLSKTLAKRQIYSIASDLRSNIIENAKQNTKDSLKKYIDFRVGDGITLKENEEDFIPVLAGMGTHLILEILKNSTLNFKKIITISNNNHDILRKNMLKLGYISKIEEIIKEKNKYYNLIIFEKEKKEYTKEEELIGVNHKNITLLKEKNEILINKYKKILKRIESKEERSKLEERINILINYKYEV